MTTGADRALRRTAACLVVCLLLVLAACESESPGPTPPEPSEDRTSASGPVQLTVGMVGAEEELAAYRAITDSYDALRDDVEVDLQTWPTHAQLLRSVEETGETPDVFMVSRDDLATQLAEGRTQPVDALMDARGVDFGDGYSRDALQAFSADDRLQCMPYGISPMVMYYNKELIDFERMRTRGMDVPAQEEAWSFEAFTAAVDFASRPGRGTAGVHIEPGVRTLAPFVYGGGGQLFDDEVAPTSLALSDGDSRDALDRALEVLRQPQFTLSDEQLEQRSALEWFKRGKLGAIAGYRDLVPELRPVHGLDFDVLPMPVLDSNATVGEITGLCLSAEAESTPEAADLLVHLLDTPAVQRVVRAGYLVPANLEVALSDDFLQKGRAPAHASVFNTSVRTIMIPPLLSIWPQLEDAVEPELRQMMEVPVLDDLDQRLVEVDEQSRRVFEKASPSPSPEDEE